MKRLVGSLGLLVLLWPALPAWAVLSGATVAPGNVSAPFNRPATLTLRWTVTSGTATPAPTVARSPALLVMAPGGRIIGQVPRVIQGTVPPGASAVIVETVQLPRSLMQSLYRARDRMGGPFPYFELRRSFSDADNTVVSAPSSLFLTGGGGSGLFDITRLALHFDDLSTVRLVPRGDELRAVLDVQFTGSGQLAGVWELADPASTAGRPVFRPVHAERTALVGARDVQIRSPSLPTDREGMHLLRFRLTAPETDFAPVMIRYVVTSEAIHDRPPVNLHPEAPGDGSLIGPETVFSWHADTPAGAYRLEIYSQVPGDNLRLPDLGGPVDMPPRSVDGPPVTGMLLPGDVRTTHLSAVVFGRLRPGRGYWWRVRAIGTDGGVIGESPLQEFRTP